MDASNKEILRSLRELLEITERNTVRYDRMDKIIASCLTTGSTTPSSSTYTGSDVCGISDVPAPASSDSDGYLVTIDAAAPAFVDKGPKVLLPTSTGFITTASATCSTEGLSRDTNESRSAPAPTMAPTVHTAIVDGQATSGVALTPATCSMVCLHQHRVADPVLVAASSPTPAEHIFDTNDDTSSLNTNGCVTEVPASACSIRDQDTLFASMGDPTVELLRGVVTEAVPMSAALQGSSSSVSIVEETLRVEPSASTTAPMACSTDCSPQQSTAALVLVASSPPTPNEYVLAINRIHVAEVPLAMTFEFPTVIMPMVQLQQLYNDSEFVMPTSSQRITSKVHVHRPMPWPSFLYFDANRDESRPLPWPSFKVMYDRESPSDAVMKVSRQCSSDSSPATLCEVMEFRVTSFYGNLSSSTGCIITDDLCNSSEWIYLNGQLLFLEHSGFARDTVQSAHTDHTPIVSLSCTISRFHWLAMVRCLELKLVSMCSMFITFSTVLVDSSSCAAFSCDCWGVHITVGIGSWLFAGCSLAVCQDFSIQISTNYFMGRESDVGVLSTMDWLLDLPCKSAVTVCSSIGPTPEAHYWIASYSVSRLLSTMNCSQLKESVVLNSMNRPVSSYDQLSCDEWLLQLRNSRWQDVSYDQFSCVIQDASCWPGYFATGIRMHKQHGELLYVTGIYQAIFSGMFHEFQNWLTYMLQHWNSCRPESAMTRAISHDSASEPIPVAFQVFALSLEIAVNHVAIGQKVLRILNHYDALRYSGLRSFTTAVYITEWVLTPWDPGQAFVSDFANVFYSQANFAGRILITLHKPQPLVQSIRTELLIREPYGRKCCLASLSLDLRSILSLKGSNILSHVVLLSFCGEPHETGYLWQGSTHAELFLVTVPLMCWLEKQLLLTCPQPNSYCSSTMFWYAYLSILIVCKVWRQTQHGTTVNICELPGIKFHGVLLEQIFVLASICRRSSLQGGRNIGVCDSCYLLAFLDMMHIDHPVNQNPVFQGGRFAMIYSIRYLAHDSYIDHLDYLDSPQAPAEPGGDQQVPWDPGGSDLLGSSTTTAWGQAVFQGGRGVRDPSYMGLGLTGARAFVMGLALLLATTTGTTSIRSTATRKPSRWIVTETALSLSSCFSDPSVLLCSSPILDEPLYPDCCVDNQFES